MEWISVKDKLPSPDINVLVYEEWAHFVWIASYGKGDVCLSRPDALIFHTLEKKHVLMQVTHWMPLPQPPLPTGAAKEVRA